jgi:hypothetical protein
MRRRVLLAISEKRFRRRITETWENFVCDSVLDHDGLKTAASSASSAPTACLLPADMLLSLSTPGESISLAFPARGGFISKQIDQEVGIFPAVTLFLCDVPSSHDNALEALPFVFHSFGHLWIRAAMAVKVVVIFFLCTHLVVAFSQ